MSNENEIKERARARKERMAAAEKKRKQRAARKRAKVGDLIFFPLLILYMELVFHWSSRGALSFSAFLLILLYSLFVGWVFLYVPLHLIKHEKARNITGAVLIVLYSLPFLIEYFVTKAFKVPYDIKTIVNGAKGVATGFMGVTLKLIFSFSGLFTIFLLLVVPLIVYFHFVRRWMKKGKADLRRVVVVGICGMVFLCVALLGIAFNSKLRGLHGKQYNFSNSVDNFGLLTGIRLDLLHLNSKTEFTTAQQMTIEIEETSTTSDNSQNPGENSGASGETSENSGENSEESKSGVESIVEVGNLITGYSRMDIDFKELAENARTQQLESLCEYADSQTVSRKNQFTGKFEGKNLILICAEAFSGAIIDPQLTPTLYRMATKGIQFTDFYQPASAGTTGGEVEVLLGVLPMSGGASMTDAVEHNMFLTMGNRLKGYYGLAMHANDAEFYDRIYTHNELGYSDGFKGYGTGMEDYVTSQWPQSDLELIHNTFPLYEDKQPFNIYYMSVSGHSLYEPGTNAMTDKHWSQVENLPYSELVRGYIACNLELEDAMTDLIGMLEEKGIADDTVIVICADHFPYGLDEDAAIEYLYYLNELYGFTVTNYLERDQNRLIIWSGCLEKEPPVVVSEPTFSLDILPTLLNLFGCEWDSRLLPGRDVFSDAPALVFNVMGDWKTKYGTYISDTDEFTPSDPSIEIPEGYVDNVTAVVWNKLNYCRGIIDSDFYDYVYDNLKE
ncbi:MAG: sulfatase-like hydrolase/transferase [Firmicutes bacterium]|nr:sulfatase-like hydrolase/transferase [Bacillota bacterium]